MFRIKRSPSQGVVVVLAVLAMLTPTMGQPLVQESVPTAAPPPTDSTASPVPGDSLSAQPLLVADSALVVAPVPAITRIPLVAVLPLTSKGISHDEAQTLTEALTVNLQKQGLVRVMERSQMDQILKEQGFQESGACDQNECAVQAGQMLGVDQLLVGNVGKVGSTWALSARLVNVATGEVVRTSMGTQKGAIDQVLTEMVPDAASRLCGIEPPVRATPSEPAPAPVAAVATPAPAPSKTWIWWTAGGVALIGGGAAAAILLASGDDEAAPQTPSASNTRTVVVKWATP